MKESGGFVPLDSRTENVLVCGRESATDMATKK